MIASLLAKARQLAPAHGAAFCKVEARSVMHRLPDADDSDDSGKGDARGNGEVGREQKGLHQHFTLL